MTLKKGLVLKNVAGSFVVVATSAAMLDFDGMITLNETGAQMWKHLEEGKTESEIVDALMNEYEVDRARAEADVQAFLLKLQEAGLAE